MRCVPDFAASLVFVRRGEARVDLLGDALAQGVELGVASSIRDRRPCRSAAASCGRRPLCGSRSAAAVDIVASCSSSLVDARSASVRVAGARRDLGVDRLDVARRARPAAWRGGRRCALTFSSLSSLASAAASRVVSSGAGALLAAVGLERDDALLQGAVASVAGSAGSAQAELGGEHVGREQGHDAAGDAGGEVREEAAVAAGPWRGGAGVLVRLGLRGSGFAARRGAGQRACARRLAAIGLLPCRRLLVLGRLAA